MGRPPADIPCATLWKGVQSVDDHLRVLTAYVWGTTNTNIQQAWLATTTVSEKARKASRGVTYLQANTGLKIASNLTAMVGALETRFLHLQDMLKESVNLIMCINRTIPLSVPPGGTRVVVTQVEFDGYTADQKRTLGVLEQLI